VSTNDAPDDRAEPEPSVKPVVDIAPSRQATVGSTVVRRALPQRRRRTVGAWCFADHFGPTGPAAGMSIGPHPHMGLHTVTWLLEGELLHSDSLGSEQLIRPGELNLMTAGHGVAHAEEEPTAYDGGMHGMQLWVAQPESTRHGVPAFEHHSDLPVADLGATRATVLIGSFGDAESPARADTALVGVDLMLPAGAHELPLRADFEHALAVFTGGVRVGEAVVGPGVLGYLGLGRDELTIETAGDTRAMLLGGEPFPDPILMWWNFVARSRDEVALATKEWNAETERFGTVESTLPRIPAPVEPWHGA
jgi:redox-sensitive bicupin YhaK (pirin superfamily)